MSYCNCVEVSGVDICLYNVLKLALNVQGRRKKQKGKVMHETCVH